MISAAQIRDLLDEAVRRSPSAERERLIAGRGVDIVSDLRFERGPSTRSTKPVPAPVVRVDTSAAAVRREWRANPANRAHENALRRVRLKADRARVVAERLAFAEAHPEILALFTALLVERRRVVATCRLVRSRLAMRERREAIGVLARRGEWLRAQHAHRERERASRAA